MVPNRVIKKISDSEFSVSFFQGTIRESEYVMMQRLREKILVSCIHLQINGEKNIYYHCDNMIPFKKVIFQVNYLARLTIIKNILGNVLAIGQNDFLKICNLAVDLDFIFVNPSTYQVNLTYIPEEHDLTDLSRETEETLIRNIADVLCNNTDSEIEDFVNLKKLLSEKSLSLQEIYSRISEMVDERIAWGRNRQQLIRKVYLRSLAPKSTKDIHFTKPRLLIGRQSPDVSGMITGSNRVGRIHCRVDCAVNGKLVIEDLNSKNGTWVNERLVFPNNPMELAVMDRVKIADLEFVVTEEET